MSSSTLRLIISALLSFSFYFAWSYWANNMVTDDQGLVLRSAVVQGTVSATVTVLFTYILEKSVTKFSNSSLSLIFIVPIICTVHSKTTQNIAIFKTFRRALDCSAKYLDNNTFPGFLFAPILPITMQAIIAISVNLLNQTPNLWLTVAPSIIITTIYGYAYMFTLLKKPKLPVLAE